MFLMNVHFFAVFELPYIADAMPVALFCVNVQLNASHPYSAPPYNALLSSKLESETKILQSLRLKHAPPS